MAETNEDLDKILTLVEDDFLLFQKQYRKVNEKGNTKKVSNS